LPDSSNLLGRKQFERAVRLHSHWDIRQANHLAGAHIIAEKVSDGRMRQRDRIAFRRLQRTRHPNRTKPQWLDLFALWRGITSPDYKPNWPRHAAAILYREFRARSDFEKSTVTGIATDYGFWELGRSSVAYRALFGESPLETLRRRCEGHSGHIAT
jgi:hypothetical protein